MTKKNTTNLKVFDFEAGGYQMYEFTSFFDDF